MPDLLGLGIDLRGSHSKSHGHNSVLWSSMRSPPKITGASLLTVWEISRSVFNYDHLLLQASNASQWIWSLFKSAPLGLPGCWFSHPRLSFLSDVGQFFVPQLTALICIQRYTSRALPLFNCAHHLLIVSMLWGCGWVFGDCSISSLYWRTQHRSFSIRV